MLIVYAILSSLGFKICDLASRRLREHGVSSHGVLSTYRWALIPAILWFAYYVPSDVLKSSLSHPFVVGYLILIAFLWNLQSFLSMHLSGITPSAGMLSALQRALYIPVLAMAGTLINNQSPTSSWYSIASLAMLSVALLMQPSSQNATHQRISRPMFYIVAIAFVRVIADAIGNSLYKETMRIVTPEVFLALFATITLFLTSFIFVLKPVSTDDRLSIKKVPMLTIAVPLLWFAASIPEVYGLAGLTIYTLASIGCITFMADIASDLKHKRINWSLRTATFVLLTTGGIAAAMATV